MTLSITLQNFTLGATTKESLINKWRMKSLNVSQNPDCYIIFVKVLFSDPAYRSDVNSGSSAFVVGSHRRIIITYDLDIYKCALQHQLDPPSSILPVSILYLLPYMTSTNQFRKVALTHVPLIVVLKLLQLFVETMVTVYIYMGGIEYHITTNLAIMIVSLMSLYMWYTKEHSL